MTPHSHTSTVDDQATHAAHRRDPHDPAGDLVSIRRNVLLSGVVGVLAALLGVAFLTRSGGGLDGLFGVLLLAIAALHLVALGSWRVPVLVADTHGIRLRIGLAWRGLPWSSIRQIVVERGESPLREGRLVIVPRDLAGTMAGLGPLSELHLRWNRLWYAAPLAVPLGMTTFVDTPDLAGDLRGLSDGRVDIADLHGSQLASLADVPARAVPAPGEAPELVAAPVAEVAPEWTLPAAPDGAVVVVGAPDGELPPPPEDELGELPPEPPEVIEAAEPPGPVLPDPVAPLRALRRGRRAEVRLERPADQDAEPDNEPETPPEVATGPADRPEAAAEPIAPLVGIPAQRRPGEIAALLAGVEIASEVPVEEPVRPSIGAKIAHAREMLDMSIDELSSRTMIRPHVLEAMEVDDFGPCGGDIYARGHLQSVARILGLSLDPLMAVYDDHYAQGPINARRVFEADLSTGPAGGMRATFGGPRWSLLISAVLCLTMIWGLARIFAGTPEHLTVAPPADTAVQAANHRPITSPLMVPSPMTVRAAYAPAHVVVRDRTGRILWSGDLAIGRQRKIVGLAPFKVSADNGGAIVVSVRGKALGTVGTAGQPAAKHFG